MNNLSPAVTDIAIIVIGYNRLYSIRRLLNSLLRADYPQGNIPLIISIDKSPSGEVGEFVQNFHWPYGRKEIVLHTQNLGLRKHVLSCSKFLEEYEAAVILEDDLIVSPQFYHFTRQAVTRYLEDERIAGISLYNFAINYHTRSPFFPQQDGNDVYFMNCAQSWGQIWLRRQWREFMEWYKNNSEEFTEQAHLPLSICHWPKSSWLKYHTRYCIENNKYFVYPHISLTTNSDDPGCHSYGGSTLLQVPFLCGRKEYYQLPELSDKQVLYDGFFERKFLGSYLNLSDDEVCIDFYGMKKNREHKRYWLTSRKINSTRIIRTFGLQLRPYEMNIIYNIPGEGLTLYDMKDIKKINSGTIPAFVLKYMYGIGSIALFLYKFGLRKLIYTSVSEYTQRMKKWGFRKVF